MKRLRPLPLPRFLSIRHFCPEQTPEQSVIYLKELCVAPYKSQVAPDFCSQTDHLTPPKGVSRIPSQAIAVHLSALGSMPSASATSRRANEAPYLAEGKERPTTPAITDLGEGLGSGL